MKRNKQLLLFVISIVLCISLIFSVVACNDDVVTPGENEESSSELFTNGSFSNTDGTSYPLTPSNWTGSVGSSSSTPSGSDNLIAGVISVEDKTFRNNRKTYGDIANPGAKGDDDNVLMIYNKVSTVYKYTSSSISLEKSSYYKLSVWVKTLNIDTQASDYNEGKSGAYIFVNGAAYAAFEAINTNGEWKLYETYIESSDISSQTITLTLSLGNGSKKENSMTKGWAFFDSITLENLSDVEEDSEDKAWTSADFNAVQESDTVAKYTMKLADSDFDYITSTTSPYTASKYSGVKGTGNGDDAPSSSDYVVKGILKTKETATVTNTSTGSEVTVNTHTDNDGRILYMQNKKATAYGMRSSVATRFAGGSQYYKISVWVKTDIKDTSKGLTIKLTDGSSDGSTYAELSNVNTQGAWSEVSFYVESNQFRYQDVYVEFWLGEGGAKDTDTHVAGVAFADDMSLSVITAEDYNNASESATTVKKSFATDLTQLTPVNLANFSADNSEDSLADRSKFAVVDTANWASSEFASIENPKTPITADDYNNVLVVNNFKPSVFQISNIYEADGTVNSAGAYTVNPNKSYVFSLWIKTQDIASTTGVNISLVSYDDTKDYEDSKTVLATFSSLNTENLADYKSATNNDYTEIRFVVQGGSEAKKVGFNISLGSGTASNSSAHATGYAFISTATVEEISASEYASTSTSTVVKTYSFVASSGSAEVSSNGSFQFVDVKATQELYDTDDFNAYDENGNLVNALGVPTNWTATDSTALSDKEVKAGVLEINNATLKNNTGFGFVNADTFYNSLSAKLPGVTAESNPNVLAISGDSGFFGYKSNSISFSANSYYMVSVWAKMEKDSVITVSLETTTKSANDSSSPILEDEVGTDWIQYTFFVKTSATSVSANLGLYIGNEDTSVSGENKTAFFTLATYTSISKEAYDLAIANAGDKLNKTIFEKSFTTDSFDSIKTATDAISTPSNWTGATVNDDSATDTDSLTAGVFNRKDGDWSWINLDPDNADDSVIVNTIFNNDTTYVGDNVLVIYNKADNAYKYTSSSLTLNEDTYYKISVWVLTYGLQKDDSATISLKINNLSYTFGKQTRTEANDIARVVNTSTYAEDGTETIGKWTQYNFYVKTEADVTPSATLSLSLGYDTEDGLRSGYVFFDNFSVDEITEEEFIARQPIEGEDPEKVDESSIAEELVPNNYRIVFTQEDADAEEETEDTTEENPSNPLTEYMWLWISSAIIGALLIVAVIVVLVKKFGKRNKKLVSSKKAQKAQTKTTTKSTSNKRDKYNK